MGSGVSVEKDTLKPILLSQELVDGSSKLASNRLFRFSFTNYIKSGIWLDRLSRLVPDAQIESSDNSVDSSGFKDCLHEYGVDHDRLISLKSSSNGEHTPRPGFHNSSKSTAFEEYGDLYSGETSGFNQEELLVLLFTIIYPLYLSSREYVRYVKYGIEHGKGVQDDSSIRSLGTLNQHNKNLVETKASHRAQELLLSCAAYYDESFLQEYLDEPSWLQRVCAIFRDHTLALCITDTSRGGLIFLFANKAFCNLFGYAESELVGNDFSIVSGSCTEMSQLQRMNSSIHSTEIEKFVITLQSKSKRIIFDLVAQQAVGSYSISTHFMKSRSAPVESLNMVNDVLLFLSYLVKAPTLPRRPSWIPAPISIIAHAASSALHAASPMSGRTRSRSHSSGGSSFGRISGRQSHGTPTSARSFGSAGVIGASRGSSSSGGDSGNRLQRRSQGAGVSTPKSYRSSGTSAGLEVLQEVNSFSAGKHVAVDVEATVECSVGELAYDDVHRHK